MKKLFTSCVICILLSACATKEPSYKKYIDHESTLFEKVVFENPVILGFGEFMTDIGSKTAYLSDIIMLPEQITFDNKTFSSRYYVAPNHYKYFLKGEKDNIQIPSSTGWSEMIRIFATQKEFGLIDTKSESIDRKIRKIKKDFNSRNLKPIYKVEKLMIIDYFKKHYSYI